MDELILQCARLAQTVSKDWDGQKQRHLLLLEALLNRTLENPGQADVGITTFELHEAVSQMLNKDWGDMDAAPKTVSAAWKKLEDLWDRKKEGLRQRARDEGLAGYPKLRKERGGGGGHSSRYYLTYERFTDDAKENRPSRRRAKEGIVRYYLDDMEKPGRVVRLLADGFLLSGWRKGLFLAVMLLVLAACGLLAWFLLAVMLHLETLGQFVSIVGGGGIIFWSVWRTLGPFFQILDRRVALAPGWLQPFKGEDDRLLLFQRNMPDAPNKILLARYTAKCPMCNGNIVIRKGAWEFPGRLIGRCEHSPREHVFSFDHYLRTGESLRG